MSAATTPEATAAFEPGAEVVHDKHGIGVVRAYLPRINEYFVKFFGASEDKDFEISVPVAELKAPESASPENVSSQPASTNDSYEGFRSIALRAHARGQRVLPIVVGEKNPAIKWKDTPIDTLSTEEWAAYSAKWIEDCAAKFPDAAACVIAKPYEFCFIDEDKSEEFRKGYEAFAGEPFPRTFTTESRTNHRQSHWLQTDATRQLGNVRQTQAGDVEFSFRQHNLYVLSEGSPHPKGGVYRAIDETTTIIPMPTKLAEFIKYLREQAEQARDVTRLQAASAADASKTPIDITPDGPPIPYREHDTTLFLIGRELCRRNPDILLEELTDRMVTICEKRCEGYGSDYVDMCKKCAESALSYGTGIPTTVRMSGKAMDGTEARLAGNESSPSVPAGTGPRGSQQAAITVEEVMDNLGVPAESKTSGLRVEDMPDVVLSGRLGEVVQQRMSIFPIAYSWLSLVAQAGVFVPSNGPLSWRPNIFYSPVGGSGSGKTEALKYAQYLLGLRSETDESFKHRYLLDVMPSSGEGLLDFIGDVNGDPRIVNPEEMSFLLERAALEGSSLPQLLDRSFNQTAFHLTKTRTRKEVFFNCRMSLVGGITMDHKDDYECVGQLFGVKSLGGFFSRYCFGLNPTNSPYYYKPFSGGPALSTEALQPVRLADDIFEANKAWVRELSKEGSRDEAARIFEVALRVYGICAAFDGKSVLTASDIEKPIKAFAQYQKFIRELIRPNPGVTPDGQLTAAFFSYLRRHAPTGERCEIREMFRATNAYKFGSTTCAKVIKAMEWNGEVATNQITPPTGGRSKQWIWLTE